METHTPTRQEALELLRRYNSNESLIKHALAVEAVMRYIARKCGENEEKWGVIGLVHDLDYENDKHPVVAWFSCISSVMRSSDEYGRFVPKSRNQLCLP